ncbi:hypothetical protein LU206_000200 [Campylobacter coli]|nr:hypothetical protein [Campylobacter coli]EIO3413245.1 hypothetical protein [Campylobacter coli]EIQ3418739.1 hypothetical protein [Campylobacter coli]EKK9353818.1 hypothetical protein [Campylobacter coli]ELB3553367.1 hypothetical protein [Campylobacter coli]
MNIIILFSLIISIALGYVLKANIGVFAILSAFIGAYLYGITPEKVINLWNGSLSLFFILLSITYFYGFAIANGTLNNLALKAVYSVRNRPWSIPIALYITVMVFVGIGPGHYAGFAFMSPLVLYIASKIKMNKILAAIIIYSGSCAGGFNPFTLGGRVTFDLIEKLGYSAEASAIMQLNLGKNMFIAHTLIFIIGYFLLKGYKVKITSQITKPKRLNAAQWKTIFIVCFVFAVIMIPSFFLALNPHDETLKKVTSIFNPVFVSFLGIVLAVIFGIGSEKEAFKNVPWDLIFMIGSLSMLIELSKTTGIMENITTFMSAFASSMGVVMPTFFSIVPSIKALEPSLAFSIIAVFATFTGYSSFSTGGALVLAGAQDESEKRYLFIRLIILPLILVVFGFVLLFLGILN